MDRSGSGREHRLTTVLVELADTLVDDYDVVDLLNRLAAYSVELLAADAAGILLGDAHQRLRVVASTNEESDWMELLQLQADEGPCVECYRTGAPVSITDLNATPPRWPRFTAAILDHAAAGPTPDDGMRNDPVRNGPGAYRSVHALPLRLRRQTIGTLNLFRTEPGPLPAADLALGQALADMATISILSERAIRHGDELSEQLQAALDSRVIIEQAKGVLAQHDGLSMDAAFERLRRYARDHNLKLSDVARQIVDTRLAATTLAERPRPGRNTPRR